MAYLILIIEDDSNIAKYIQSCLSIGGYRSETCSDGQTAVEKIQTGRYDLALLDIMLPKLDGFEVMERINAEIERCKVEGLDRERFELVKKSYYGAQVRGVNNVEAVATLMLNSAMDGVTPFDIIEIIAETTFEDVMKRLFVSLDSKYSAISIIDPAE